MTRILSVLLVACLLGGCTLIDQQVVAKWFNKTPPAPPPKPVVSGALVTVPLGSASLESDLPAVHQAVAQALGRKPDVEFDVVTVVPSTGTPAEQVSAAEAVTSDARTIARAINADGVDDNRIHLAARAEPGVTGRQIEIFVH